MGQVETFLGHSPTMCSISLDHFISSRLMRRRSCWQRANEQSAILLAVSFPLSFFLTPSLSVCLLGGLMRKLLLLQLYLQKWRNEKKKAAISNKFSTGNCLIYNAPFSAQYSADIYAPIQAHTCTHIHTHISCICLYQYTFLLLLFSLHFRVA